MTACCLVNLSPAFLVLKDKRSAQVLTKIRGAICPTPNGKCLKSFPNLFKPSLIVSSVISQSPSVSLASKMSGNFAKSMSFFHRMPHIVLIMINILDRLERWANIFGPVTPVVVVVVVVVAGLL